MTAMTALAQTLTDEQRRIVEWGDGPAVVIAGAGTGKTRVIVERIRHLLETGAGQGLMPEHLLVLTGRLVAGRSTSAASPATAARVSTTRGSAGAASAVGAVDSAARSTRRR